MAQILSQDEIDALLQASKDGQLEDDGSVKNAAVKTGGDCSNYDFHRPSLITKDQLRSFTDLHDFFCREIQTSLSLLMRAGVDIKLVSTEQQQYCDYIKTLPTTTYMAVLSANEMPGMITVEMNLALIFGLVDLRLGGSGGVETQIRQPTEVEVAIVEPILDRVRDNLRGAFTSVLNQILIKIERIEFNPAYLQAAPSDAPVVVISFDVKVGETVNGILNICYPVPAIMAVLDKIALKASEIGSYYGTKDAVNSRKRIMETLVKIPVKGLVRLGSSILKGKELLNIAPGDIIILDKRVGDPLILSVSGHPLFKGAPGMVDKKLGFKIHGTAG